MFRLLSKINKLLLPSLSKQNLDLSKASSWQKAMLAWRYYVTIRSLKKNH